MNDDLVFLSRFTDRVLAKDPAACATLQALGAKCATRDPVACRRMAQINALVRFKMAARGGVGVAGAYVGAVPKVLQTAAHGAGSLFGTMGRLLDGTGRLLGKPFHFVEQKMGGHPIHFLPSHMHVPGLHASPMAHH